MTKERALRLAQILGWKLWGKPHTRSPGNDSKYQCCRRGNRYIWIGNYFIERDDEIVAHDYVNSTVKSTRDIIAGKPSTGHTICW
jgi:hypothetical protein